MKRCVKAIAALMLSVVISLSGCVKDPTNVNVNENVGYDIPEVETSIVQDITETTAKVGGVVTSSAGGSIIERGLCWGTESNPTVNGNHIDCGTGAGSFSCQLGGLEPNTTYHVRAYAINSVGIGYGADVRFTTPGGNTFTLPEGAINGIFSVGSGKKVCFSKGNLQYNIATQEWSFMEHQYDMVEYSGQDVGTNYSNQNIVSLFCAGTSGYHNNYPYLTWISYSNVGSNNVDWGSYNRITNGGNQTGIWQTMTGWNYVFNERMTPSGIRYAKGCVNGVNGLILLPDDWNQSVYRLYNTNIHDAAYNSNVISVSQWNTLEVAGAVFLPAAGYRDRNIVYEVGDGLNYRYPGCYYLSYDNYGSSIMRGPNEPWYSDAVYISGTYLYYDPSGKGYSVRLVCPVE